MARHEARRKRPPAPPAPAEPPPLYDDPLEALYLVRQRQMPAAFKCPVDAIVDLMGFGLRRGAWHPFVAAARELDREDEAAAEALLERYYAVFRPDSAAGAYVGFRNAPSALRSQPPHLFYAVPWEARPIEQLRSEVPSWSTQDNTEHGRGDLTLANSGHSMFGPVAPDKRKLELRRLAALHVSLTRTGFDRATGDCRYLMIRRDREVRCIPFGGGYHRASVMAALGADWVPAQFYHPLNACVDVADVDYWPKVRDGLWSRRQALAYVDYLFNYNSSDWESRHSAELGLAGPKLAPRRTRNSTEEISPVLHTPRGYVVV